jgi:exodeoxyribonuclease VII large subunit
LNVMGRRFANVHVLIAPVRVQGAEAPGEIVQAIEMLNRIPDVDVLIVGRGGGSLEDLWAFNDEGVARAIFASQVPVISAVGHEVDFTIADFVADLRAPTPSAAAELVVQNKEDLQYTLDTLTARLHQVMQNRLSQWQYTLAQYARGLQDPRKRLHEAQQRVDDMQHRLLTAFRHIFDTKRYQLEKAAGKLDSLSPLGLLARGYAVCRHAATSQVVKSIHDTAPGDVILARVSDGELTCEVTEVHEV